MKNVITKYHDTYQIGKENLLQSTSQMDWIRTIGLKRIGQNKTGLIEWSYF